MTSTVSYSGELRTLATHLQSGSTFETDAPTDNQGKGARFSPTDLIGTALAACMLTTIAIKAKDLEEKLKGASATTEKIMTAAPRKIGAIQITFNWIPGVIFSDEERKRIEDIAWSCPVKESIHPSINLNVDFNWG
ncbi:MAG: OsmC family protein [bacterium]